MKKIILKFFTNIDNQIKIIQKNKKISSIKYLVLFISISTKDINQRVYRYLLQRNLINKILGRIIYGNDCGLRKNLIGLKNLKINRIELGNLIEIDHSNYLKENGYVKLDNVVNSELLKSIKKKFEEKLEKEGDFTNDLRFDFTSLENPNFFNNFSEVKQILNDKIVNTIQGYYSSYFTITNVHIYRIKKNPNHNHLDTKSYSQTVAWHNDGASTDTIKIIISLNKLGEKDGPMQFISLKETKNIYRSSSFFPTKKKLINKIKNYKKMLFNQNDAYIINANHCLHRASSPETEHRDLLTFVCRPTYKSKPINWEIDSTKNIYEV